MFRVCDDRVVPAASPSVLALSCASFRRFLRVSVHGHSVGPGPAAYLACGLGPGLCLGLCLIFGILSCTPRRLPAPAPVAFPEPVSSPETAEVEAPVEPVSIEALRPEPEHVENWEAFSNSVRMLRGEIQRGGYALKIRGADEAPVGLASLRLCLDAWDLIQTADNERAVDLLERAISLDGRNGFAYLFLAYAYHRSARFEQGRLFLGQAWRYLPYDPRVLGEFEGLKQSIELNTASSAVD